MSPGLRFRVLCVCTGNLCRSPIAERVLRARLSQLSEDVEVSSAGTSAVPGRAMDPYAERVLAEIEVSEDSVSYSRPLTAELVVDADLILTSERAQREVVFALDRTAWGRTFTLPEFARLAVECQVPDAEPGARLRTLVAAAADARALYRAERPEDDDLEDPVGARYRTFWRVGQQIAQSAVAIADAVAQTPARSVIDRGLSVQRPPR